MDNEAAKIKANLAANASRRAREASAKAKLQKVSKKGKGSGKKTRAKTKHKARASDGRKAAGQKANLRAGVGVTIKIGKKGGNVCGLVDYAFKDSKDHKIIFTTIGETKKDAEETFNALKKLRPDVKDNVGHFSINLPEDTNFDQKKWNELVEFTIQEMGVTEQMPTMAVQHFDTKKPHAHVIFSRIGYNGKVHDERYLKWLALSTCEKIEQKYKLNLHPRDENNRGKKSLTKNEIEMSKRTGKIPPRALLQAACDAAMASSKTMPEYFEQLKKMGVTVQVSLQLEGRKLNGIAYERDGFAISASKLGDRYTPYNLHKKGIQYEFDRDFESVSGRAVVRRVELEAPRENAVYQPTDGDNKRPAIQISIGAVEVEQPEPAEPRGEADEPQEVVGEPNDIDLPVIMPVGGADNVEPPRADTTAIPTAGSRANSQDTKASTKSTIKRQGQAPNRKNRQYFVCN